MTKTSKAMNLEMTCRDFQFDVDEKSIYDTFKDDVELRLQTAIDNKLSDKKSIYEAFKNDLEVVWHLREAFVNKTI